jgi:hypothetical protein
MSEVCPGCGVPLPACERPECETAKLRAELTKAQRGLAAWEALAEWERADVNRAVTVEPVTDIFLMCAGDGDDGATGNGATPTEAALSLCESLGLPTEKP